MTFDAASWRCDASVLRQAFHAADTNGFGRWMGQHVDYSELSDRFWALLKAANITVVPTNSIDWKNSHDVDVMNPAWYRSASLEDVAMASTHLERTERHWSGAWLAAFENGTIPALIERLEALTDELPYDPATSPWTNRYYL